MNTNQLMKCIGGDELLSSQCVGVFPSDKLPRPRGRPECLIANLDPSRRKGSHWIAIYIDQEGFGQFFDSYGRMPEKTRFRQYLRQNCEDWTNSGKPLQSIFSSTCGHYCIYFLYHRVRGRDMESILNDFSENREENDIIVSNWLDKCFDVHTNVFEFEFVQLCSALQ